MQKVNQKKTNTWKEIGTIAFLIIVVVLLSKIKCSPPDNPNQTDFPKDTIFRDTGKYVHDTLWKDYTGVVPIVTKYVDSSKHKPIEYIKVPYHDTEWIFTDTGSLWVIYDTLNFNPDFITTLPGNPKLIKSMLKQNSLSFDLLDTSARMSTYTYPINLSKYTYLWEDGILKARKNKGGFFSGIKPVPELFSTITYNPFRNSSRIDLSGTIWLGKLGFTTYVSATTNTSPIIDAGIGTRIKLR